MVIISSTGSYSVFPPVRAQPLVAALQDIFEDTTDVEERVARILPLIPNEHTASELARNLSW